MSGWYPRYSTHPKGWFNEICCIRVVWATYLQYGNRGVGFSPQLKGCLDEMLGICRRWVAKATALQYGNGWFQFLLNGGSLGQFFLFESICISVSSLFAGGES